MTETKRAHATDAELAAYRNGFADGTRGKQTQIDAARAEGRRLERGAIVAWMGDIRYGMAGREAEWTRFLAMRIANGEHEKKGEGE